MGYETIILDTSSIAAMIRAKLLSRQITSELKGLPPIDGNWTVGSIADAGWRLRDLVPPVAVLRRSALVHNCELMARYCREHGLELAPHGKTTMAPQLFEMQLARGAWGITVATPRQASIAAEYGVKRILLAHEVTDPLSLARLAALVAESPGLDLLVLADSVEGVRSIDAALADAGTNAQIGILVEVGVAGGRTGCRTLDELLAVADAVREAPRLQLRGVEGYEGVIDGGALHSTLHDIDRFLDHMVDAVKTMLDRRFFDAPPVLSAGGSAYFDRVADRFQEAPSEVVRVLRSGCYLVHDHGKYQRLSPLDGRASSGARLEAALEVWASVVSTPEPGMAVLDAGRRDVSFDAGLPRAVRVLRAGSSTVENLDGSWEVSKLMDQHAMLPIPEGERLALGDRVALGISHPCTTFDKWKVIPVVDDEDAVVDAIVTLF